MSKLDRIVNIAANAGGNGGFGPMPDDRADVQVRWKVDLPGGGYTAGTVVVPRDQWDAATPEQRTRLCSQAVGGAVVRALDVDWNPVNARVDEPVRRDQLAELHSTFAEADRNGASSNDIAQILDDFLTERGYPSVLYTEKEKRVAGERDDDCPTCHRSWTWAAKNVARDERNPVWRQVYPPLCQDDWHVNHHTEETR